jgi:hypothetical protein
LYRISLPPYFPYAVRIADSRTWGPVNYTPFWSPKGAGRGPLNPL